MESPASIKRSLGLSVFDKGYLYVRKVKQIKIKKKL